MSIVTPCYNGAETLHRYFSGVSQQSYGPLELVFVNDGSTDRTEQLFRELALSLVQNRDIWIQYVAKANGGPCSAINTGFAHAHGEYFVFCDSDDMLLPDAVNQFLRGFETNPSSDMIFTRYRICACDGSTIGEGPAAPVPTGGAVYDELLSRGMFIKAGAYCFRRRCLDLLRHQELDESFYGQNLELLLRISATRKVVFHDATTVAITVHPESRSRKRDLAALRRQVLDSKRLQLEIVAEYGCSRATFRKLQARFLPGESQLYFLEGKPLKVIGCLLQALRFGKASRRLWLHALCCLTPATRRYLIRRWYADYR